MPLEILSASYLKVDDIEYFKQLPTLKSLDIQDTDVSILKEFIKESTAEIMKLLNSFRKFTF